MYLGRGRVEQGKFVADSTGRHIYVGHNRENIGDLFKTYDASNVFAADTRKIARAEYSNELKRIESMDSVDLISFLSNDKTPAFVLRSYPRTTLVRMARNRYFKRSDMCMNPPIATTLTSGIPAPQIELAKNAMLDLKLNQKTM